MTKEQAAEVLKCNTDLGYGVIIENESTQSIYEALDMAIKELEQEPYEDTVSRQTVKENNKYGFRTPYMTVTEFIEDLEE